MERKNMKFVKRQIEIFDAGPCYAKTKVYQYTTEDGVIYQKMDLGWYDIEGKRLIGDISHLSKAADDFELEQENA